MSAGEQYYEIHVQAVLDSSWMAWFENLRVNRQGDHTVISGPIVDQAALHGILDKVRDLGLTLLLVRRLDPDEAS